MTYTQRLSSMNAQRRSKIEALRTKVSSVGIPLPADVVHELAQMNPADVRKVLLDHPGHESWEALQSYDSSLNVFHKAFTDLLGAIDQFAVLAREGRLLGRRHEDEYSRVEDAVQKELFAASNAAHSLVDHSTRRLQDQLNIPNYAEAIARFFRDDGLHDFVIGLRTILHHVKMHRPGWSLRRDAASPELQIACQLDRVALQLHSEKLNARALSYLESASPKIDARAVFDEYHRRATAFHTWFREAIDSGSLGALRDYERCLQENDKTATRTFWKAMVGNWLNWTKPPNPYDYLDRYLTSDERDLVNALPSKSREQVDRIIAFVDRNSACDDELRQLIYRLFDRAP